MQNYKYKTYWNNLKSIKINKNYYKIKMRFLNKIFKDQL